MNKDKRLSPLGSEMVAGLSAFCDALESGEAVWERFTIRTVKRCHLEATNHRRDERTMRTEATVDEDWSPDPEACFYCHVAGQVYRRRLAPSERESLMVRLFADDLCRCQACGKEWLSEGRVGDAHP